MRAGWIARPVALCAVVVATLVPSAAADEPTPVWNPGKPLVYGPESLYALVNEGDPAWAEMMLRDLWPMKRFAAAHVPAPRRWDEDPFGESYWRFLYYSLRPTSNLLWAYYTTSDVRYRDKLLEILEGYAEWAVPRRKERWREGADNKHTTAFRGMIYVNSYVKLRRSNDLTPQTDALLRAAIEKIGKFLAEPINFDPGYNHGMTQAVSLMLIAHNLPELPQSQEWWKIGTERLVRLINETVDGDGVEVENSPFYHFYVITFLAQVDVWGRTHGVPLPAEISSKLRAMMRYATYVPMPNGYLPLTGSSVALSAQGIDSSVYDPLAQKYPEFRFIRTGGKEGRAPKDRNAFFKERGEAIMRSGFSREEFKYETQVVFNVGRYRSSHSHLDVLGLNLYSAGTPLLPDSGLFTYEVGDWGTYFGGTRAHNTVVVDGQDQTTGDNLEAGLNATGPDWAYQSGSHGLYRGVRHRRAVALLGRDVTLVYDHLRAHDEREYAQTWHLFPGARARREGLSVTAANSKGQAVVAISQAVSDGVSVRHFHGSLEPMQGWHSEKYEARVPNHAYEYVARGKDAVYATLLTTGRRARAAAYVSLDRDPSGSEATITVCADEVRRVVRITDLGGERERVQVRAAGAACAPVPAQVVQADAAAATVEVRCLAARTCHGTLALSGGAGKRMTTLGRASFVVPPGRSAPVRVRLRSSAGRLLAEQGRMPGLVSSRVGRGRIARQAVVVASR